MKLVEHARALVRRLGWRRAIPVAFRSLYLLRLMRWPIYDRRELRAVRRVVRSRNWGGLPMPNVHAKAFADRFAQLHGARFGLCTSSGSTALTVAYRAIGLRPGDELLVPALTFRATASSALELGAKPVFVDVDPATMCISPERACEAITSRTRAIAVVHLGSQLADMDRLLALAADFKLKLIEDCAHAHGARWGARGAGSLGDIGCFSFQSGKAMTAGEGGLVTTNDPALAARCEANINCGRSSEDGRPPYAFLGSNLRMTEFQAAILLVQLERLPEQSRRRQRNMALLTSGLEGIAGIEVLRLHPKVTAPGGYGYYFRYLSRRSAGVPIQRFVSDLNDEGVPAQYGRDRPVYWSPDFGWRDASVEVDYTSTSCPVAERAAREELVWIPHPFFLGKAKHIVRAARIVAKLVERYRANIPTARFCAD